MSIQEIFMLLSLIATVIIGVVGFGFTIYQIKKANKVKKAEFVLKLLEHIRLDDRLINAAYIIDYTECWYDASFHNSGELEKTIDALLSHVDYICYLYNNNLLNEDDFSVFKYKVVRICDNYQCKCYLWNLYHRSDVTGVPCSFLNLINYMKSCFDEEELIAFESNNEETSGYIKYLNF